MAASQEFNPKPAFPDTPYLRNFLVLGLGSRPTPPTPTFSASI